MGSEMAGKVVVITGAGGGIGLAVAQQFAKDWHQDNVRLVLNDKNGESLMNAVEACMKNAKLAKENLVTVSGDVCEATVRDEVHSVAVSTFGRADVLVNCAGILVPGASVPGCNPEDLEKTMRLNADAAYHMAMTFRDELIKTKGTVVNMSSVAGLRPSHNRLFYCMSKAALEQITRCMAVELGRFGVRVNSVAPGLVPTELHSSRDQVAATKGTAVREYYDAQALKNPMCRNGTAEEVANAVLFLASDKASYINGHCLVVDGGLSLAGPLLD